ncbi:transporter [Klebsiella pneumoniae]|nr:transporter [Klebsiella pneumoniae]SYL04033.1 transporter [Klebsiella pneumoniae]
MLSNVKKKDVPLIAISLAAIVFIAAALLNKSNFC